ncbi:MAG: isoprenylcysteine carboxylmethyltransferase family protein [Bermanella sp.]
MLELKIPPPVAALVMAGLMYVSKGLYQDVFGFELEYKWLMAAMISVLALLLDFAALWVFVRAKTTVNPIKASNVSALVTSGIYRYSRNPMYVGNFLFLFAWLIFLSSALNAIFLVFYVLYTNKFQITPEERILRERFGDDYRAFCLRVRRWV